MLGELSGSIAHELNLPLSAILSNAQAAQRILANGDADLAELREILNDIVSEDKRAGEVIRRLRLWLKKGEVQQHSLRINEVVQDVLKLIRSDLVNQNVTADVELARNLPTVTGDPVQLQQVLVNLVVNACDAMADLQHSGAPAAHSHWNSRTMAERSDCIRHRPGRRHSGGKNGTNLRAFLHHESQRAWGSAFRSAVASLLRIEGNSGPQTMPTAARRSTSAFL